jgi:hypothetical protein
LLLFLSDDGSCQERRLVGLPLSLSLHRSDPPTFFTGAAIFVLQASSTLVNFTRIWSSILPSTKEMLR